VVAAGPLVDQPRRLDDLAHYWAMDGGRWTVGFPCPTDDGQGEETSHEEPEPALAHLESGHHEATANASQETVAQPDGCRLDIRLTPLRLRVPPGCDQRTGASQPPDAQLTLATPTCD
jgi:hypothetical protein